MSAAEIIEQIRRKQTYGRSSCLTFLDMNGIECTHPEMGLYDFIIGIAEKRYTKSMANYLREGSARREV